MWGTRAGVGVLCREEVPQLQRLEVRVQERLPQPHPSDAADPHSVPTNPRKYMQMYAKCHRGPTPPGLPDCRGLLPEPWAPAAAERAPERGRKAPLPSPGRCRQWPEHPGPSSGSRPCAQCPGTARVASAPVPRTRGPHNGALPAESPGQLGDWGQGQGQGPGFGREPTSAPSLPDTCARSGVTCSRWWAKATTFSMRGCSASCVSQALVHRTLKSGWGRGRGAGIFRPCPTPIQQPLPNPPVQGSDWGHFRPRHHLSAGRNSGGSLTPFLCSSAVTDLPPRIVSLGPSRSPELQGQVLV